MPATAVKERPIIFSGESVRAILEGRKTQTRRVVSHQPQGFEPQWDGMGSCTWWHVENDKNVWEDRRCPYGQPGDRLWVRETFQLGTCDNPKCHGMAGYDDGDSKLHPESEPGSESWARLWKRIPSIHMPRWASRITLEVTDVRVERLQEISEEDAEAEGCGFESELFDAYEALDLNPSDCFRRLWDEINAKRGFPWDSNPFVWAISFRRADR